MVLLALRKTGVESVTLYGAGQHTQKVLSILKLNIVKVSHIIDDSQNGFLVNIPIISSNKAKKLNISNIIISSDTYENQIYKNCQETFSPSVKISKLYSTQTENQLEQFLLKNFSEYDSNTWHQKLASLSHMAADSSFNKSVLFLHNSYYHFYYLSKALRKRSWKAFTVSLEAPGGPHSQFYHGEDINLYSSSEATMQANILSLLEFVKDKIKIVHFAGDGMMSFFPTNFSKFSFGKEFIDLKKLGIKIGYTVSGCNSGVSQTSFRKWSKAGKDLPTCDTCIWQDNHDICSDKKNLSWGKIIEKNCDLIASEFLPALDYLDNQKSIFTPLTTCLPNNYISCLEKTPEKHLIEKKDDEILIYHAVGNYKLRSNDTKNIKGTPYVIEAIDRLKKAGYNVNLIFVTDIPNKEIIYYQMQADIIIDQLHFGRYGATAREGMMLGKPVVGYFAKHEFNPNREISFYDEVPIVNATEKTIYEVLKSLINNNSLRKEIGQRSRDFAMKWHSPDACAKRFEETYQQRLLN